MSEHDYRDDRGLQLLATVIANTIAFVHDTAVAQAISEQVLVVVDEFYETDPRAARLACLDLAKRQSELIEKAILMPFAVPELAS